MTRRTVGPTCTDPKAGTKIVGALDPGGRAPVGAELKASLVHLDGCGACRISVAEALDHPFGCTEPKLGAQIQTNPLRLEERAEAHAKTCVACGAALQLVRDAAPSAETVKAIVAHAKAMGREIERAAREAVLQIAGTPETGQIVQVRGRRWIVSAVSRSALVEAAVGGGGRSGPPQHLVTLTSVEDDALGEDARVVWEIEPGVAALERGGLPSPSDGFDPPARLDAFLQAVRWGATVSADPRMLQAPFRSGVAIEDYQLDPVARAVTMPRANLLIADDVGLGKTIEAGLVIQEFLTRHRARSVLVVCPASLTLQWKTQMLDKFGLEFRVVDAELLRDLRRTRGIHVNPWTHFPRLITSIDFLKRERPLRLMRDALPRPGEPAYPRRFDILVVDEAHNVAPSGRAQGEDSLRTRTIRELAPHFEHKLFLTATPHNGYGESFQALLELLDDQRFHRGIAPAPEQLARVMIRRLKTELPKRWDGSERSAKRLLEPIKVEFGDEEREVHTALKRYAELRREKTRSGDSAGGYALDFVFKLLKKRLFSSPRAFLCTLEAHRASVREARRAGDLGGPSRRALELRAEALDTTDYGDEEELEQATADAVDAAARLLPSLDKEEAKLLSTLRVWAEKHAGRADAKARELLAWLGREIKPGGAWSDKRVIIFTEYRDTLDWLKQLLAAHGFTAEGDRERIMVLHGALDTDERERVKTAFLAPPDVSPVRILLATDAASEGIDLQDHCSRLIHYEIPWNPNRMEQRNGRIHRYGQRDPFVRIYHFVDARFQEDDAKAVTPGDLRGDLEFLYRAAQRIERIEADLFGKVAPVIAAQVEEAMLGRRARLDPVVSEQEAEPMRRVLRLERDLAATVKRLHEQVLDARKELEISPERVAQVVAMALEIAAEPPLVEVALPGGARGYRLPPFKGPSWARCAEGLQDPFTHETRPVTFDPKVAEGRRDVVLLHLNHRLVQMSLRLLRAEVWAQETRRGLHRVTARLAASNATLEGPALLAHARLVVLGGDGRRLHEEVLAAGGLIVEGKLRRFRSRAELDRALQSGTGEAAPAAMQSKLAELWPKHEQALLDAIEARATERFQALQKDLEKRREQEREQAEHVLQELERRIAKELHDEPGAHQFAVFTTDEDRRLFDERRKKARPELEERLERIPRELERERKAIEERYADLRRQVFPAAVTYVVPPSLARG